MSDGHNFSSLEALAWNAANKPATLGVKLDRCLQVARHYNWVRIARRGMNTVPAKVFSNRRIGTAQEIDCDLRPSDRIEQLAKITARYAAKHPSHQQCELARGTFVLLNHRAALGTPKTWDRSTLGDQAHLWRFQLHYHEYLLCYAENGQWEDVGAFLSQWLPKYAPEKTLKRDDAWHPYCLSRRIVAWIGLLSLSQRSGDADTSGLSAQLQHRMLKSTALQTDYLSRHLERDLGGNHLLENGVALAIAGSAIDCSRSQTWKSIAARIFQTELPKQILAHGEHFERAPMYHCQILGALLRIQACCDQTEPLHVLMCQHVPSMLKFLLSITHPDGEIPLFADSGFHEAPSVKEIIELAELNGYQLPEISNRGCVQVGDYQIFRSDSVFAIADFGSIAAPGLPAHGHCDAFTFELSIAGKRWIVDSGNYNYQDDSMRHYCRSSISHNVTTIDDENQAVIWSKFRMGNRPQITNHRTGKKNDWNWRSASHDGYRNRKVDSLERVLANQADSFICVDVAKRHRPNRPSTNLSGFLHFHPLIKVDDFKTEDGVTEIFLIMGNESKKLIVFSQMASLETGWYCESFGKRETTCSVRYSSPVADNMIGWFLTQSDAEYQIEQSPDTVSIKIANHSVFQWQVAN